MAGVRGLCPAVVCGGGGDEGAAERGGHAAEHRARLPEHRQEGFGRGTDTTGLPEIWTNRFSLCIEKKKMGRLSGANFTTREFLQNLKIKLTSIFITSHRPHLVRESTTEFRQNGIVVIKLSGAKKKKDAHRKVPRILKPNHFHPNW